MPEVLIANLVLGAAAPATAEFASKPALTFKDVRFSKAQNQQRKWTATLTVDASRCAATTGQFEIGFVRLKEFAPDLVFTEKFRWTPGSVDASLNFWWDEAVQDYWIGDVEPCGCADWLAHLRRSFSRSGVSREAVAVGNYGSHKLVMPRPWSLAPLLLRPAQISTREGE
jgi:hypothetical protein